jgi:hypothetical protein
MLYFSDDDEYFRPRRALKVIKLTEEYITTRWKPFNDVEVVTTLIPAGNFHVRVHKIKAGRNVITKEGGFAIPLYNGCDIELDPKEIKDCNSSISVEMPWDVSVIEDPLNMRKAAFVCPTPNVNLMASNTIVPYLDGIIQQGESTCYVTLVGAAHNDGKYYTTRPTVKWDERSSTIFIDKKSITIK